MRGPKILYEVMDLKSLSNAIGNIKQKSEDIDFEEKNAEAVWSQEQHLILKF